jgi:hypothetical protein
MLNNKQGDDTWKEQPRLELVLNLLCEVGMQVSCVQSQLEVVDGWQGIWKVLHERKDL